jgi:hypothetical protein
MVQFSFI